MIPEISKDKFPNCFEGLEYCRSVVEGRIVAGIYIMGACKRFLRDLQDPRWEMRWAKAERYLRLVQKFHHVVGTWDTPNIIYNPWQKWVWMNIMGLYSKETNNRKYRTAHVEIPRGNTKSTMASQCGLFFVALDEDSVGPEVSCVATRREQARIVLDSARKMAKKNKSFLKANGVEVLRNKIVKDETDACMQSKSSDSTGLDGLMDVLAICDELHAMKTATFEVIDSGMSKRKDSLLLCITTAGSNVESTGFSQSCYAKEVALNKMQDETFFSAVYCPDKDDDVFEESTWKKANPNYGFSVDPTNFKAKAMKALNNPQDAANFKIKHLNMWISEANAFFPMDAWDKCAVSEMKWEDFKDRKCFTAIDLASKVDLTAIAYLFRDENDVIDIWVDAYVPEETIKNVKLPIYEQSVANGSLMATKGAAINYPKLQEDFELKIRQVRNVATHYDPWSAAEFSQRMSQKRIEMVEFPMRTSNLSEPTKDLAARILEGKVRHNGNPLLRWNMGNVVAKEDANGNIFPRKSHEKLKIDMAVAIIMAWAGWVQEKKEESVYSQRGFRFL